MKTKTFLTIAVLILATSMGFAKGKTKQNQSTAPKAVTDVQINHEGLVVVRYLDARNEKIKVTVQNSDGECINRKMVKAEGDIKLMYDLTKLPEGTFTFTIKNGKNVLCQKAVSKTSDNKLGVPYEIDKYNTIPDMPAEALMTTK